MAKNLSGFSDRENIRKKPSAISRMVSDEVIAEPHAIGLIEEPEQQGRNILNEATTKAKSEKSAYVQKGYWITENQFRKINIYAAISGMDKSEVVREALEQFFKDKKIGE